MHQQYTNNKHWVSNIQMKCAPKWWQSRTWKAFSNWSKAINLLCYMVGSSSDQPQRHFLAHIFQKYNTSELCERPKQTNEILINLKYWIVVGTMTALAQRMSKCKSLKEITQLRISQKFLTTTQKGWWCWRRCRKILKTSCDCPRDHFCFFSLSA